MPCRPSVRTVLALLALACFPAPSAGAEGLFRIDGAGRRLPAPVPQARDVKDPVFAALVGVVEDSVYGVLDAAALDSVARAGGGSRLPHEEIHSLSRRPGAGWADGLLALQLRAPLRSPIPYSILGYHPGSMRASERIELVQWTLGELELDLGDGPLRLQGAELLLLTQGSLEMDIDGWLDRLLGGKLDDVRIAGFLLFRLEGRRLGLAFGRTPRGKGRTGVFDLAADEVDFPSETRLLRLGRYMRERAERALERGIRP